jgi:flagellar basal-body rod modification protein FlgD
MSTTIPPISNNQGSQQSSSNSNNSTNLGGAAPSESTFLTLLVTQLKNQDPLNPTDSTQFVSELAQFSSLEQLMNINQSVGSIKTTIDPTAATGSGSSGSASNSQPTTN